MNDIHIHWYPGHIAKAHRELKERLKLVDCVVEMVDARLPTSSHFKFVDQLVQGKQRVIVINKIDLVPQESLVAAQDYWKDKGFTCILMHIQKKKGINQLKKVLEVFNEEIAEKMKQRGRLPRPLRTMVMGLPNVGKSSLINALSTKKAVKVGNKPGVTRAMRWTRLAENLELLDTPGVIPPKFEDQNFALKLALIGSVSDISAKPLHLAEASIKMLREEFPGFFKSVYGDEAMDLAGMALKRHHMAKNGEPDVKRAARTFLQEFRSGKLKKMTLEPVPSDC